ncbi:hypothetical protein WJX74_003435 [Apatococcus lobatus]|uniref:Uncharacterized protein n=1 Tax=Apatococcus lobatus TaxID=904363 RepID=A0AAW1SB50_9CHLO
MEDGTVRRMLQKAEAIERETAELAAKLPKPVGKAAHRGFTAAGSKSSGPQRTADDAMAQLLSISTSMVQTPGGPGPARLARHSSGIPMASSPLQTGPSGIFSPGHTPLMSLRSQAASIALPAATELQRPIPSSDASTSSPDAGPKQPYPQSLQSLSPSAIEPAKIPSGARRGSDMFSVGPPGREHSLSLELGGAQMQVSPSYTLSNLGKPRISSGTPFNPLPSEKAALGTILEIPGLSFAGTPFGPSVAGTPRTSVVFPTPQAAVGMPSNAPGQSAAYNSMRRASTAAGLASLSRTASSMTVASSLVGTSTLDARHGDAGWNGKVMELEPHSHMPANRVAERAFLRQQATELVQQLAEANAIASSSHSKYTQLLVELERRQESFIRREQGNIDRIRLLEEQLAQQGQQREADITSGRDEFGTKGAIIRELHTDLMQMLGEATSVLHVDRPPAGQQGHQHQPQRTRQEVGEGLEALCSRLQAFEDQAAVDRTRNLQGEAKWGQEAARLRGELSNVQKAAAKFEGRVHAAEVDARHQTALANAAMEEKQLLLQDIAGLRSNLQACQGELGEAKAELRFWHKAVHDEMASMPWSTLDFAASAEAHPPDIWTRPLSRPGTAAGEVVLHEERTEGGLQRALASKQYRERMSQDARHSERQHKDMMKGFKVPGWEARPATAPNPGILASFGASGQSSSRGSAGGLTARPPLAVRQSPPTTRSQTAKGPLSSPTKTPRGSRANKGKAALASPKTAAAVKSAPGMVRERQRIFDKLTALSNGHAAFHQQLQEAAIPSAQPPAANVPQESILPSEASQPSTADGISNPSRPLTAEATELVEAVKASPTAIMEANRSASEQQPAAPPADATHVQQEDSASAIKSIPPQLNTTSVPPLSLASLG